MANGLGAWGHLKKEHTRSHPDKEFFTWLDEDHN